MMLFDTVDASGVRITNDGFLVAEASVARTGIQLYSAAELGLDGEQTRIVRVYRPPEEVFAADAMASYAHRPVTVDHPNVMIDAANWKEHAKGQTGDEVLRDGEFVRVPLMLMDQAAIEDWTNGKRELSMGYTMTLDVTDGETPEGEKYDAIQRNLRMNHLALVSRARGGSELKLGDDNLEVSNMSEVKLSTVTVDGLSVQTTDAGAQAISKLQTELADAQTDLVNAGNTHEGELATKDAELATKDAEIDTLKGKVLSDADIDKRVNDRADLIATAKQIADKDYSGLSDAEIKSTAVVAKLGQATVDGKSADYISARFDILAEDAAQDPVRKVVRGQVLPAGDAVDQAHAKMVDDMGNAWKQNGGAE
jgi:hypothetical protein